MTDRLASRLAWGLFAVSTALVVAGVWIGLAGGGPGLDDPDAGTNLGVGVTIGAVGALLASRRREHVIGWLLLAMSLVASITLLAGTVAVVAALDGRISNGALMFEVRDDGSGFDPAATAYGTGLQGMADRLDAIGGSLKVASGVGGETRVTGRIPVGAGR